MMITLRKQIVEIIKHLLILFKRLISKQILSILTLFDHNIIFYIKQIYRDLTSRPHMAGLPEDLESAQVIEQRWKNDGLYVTKPKYNVLLSYPDQNNPNR